MTEEQYSKVHNMVSLWVPFLISNRLTYRLSPDDFTIFRPGIHNCDSTIVTCDLSGKPIEEVAASIANALIDVSIRVLASKEKEEVNV
jgi:hypothetical protein